MDNEYVLAKPEMMTCPTCNGVGEPMPSMAFCPNCFGNKVVPIERESEGDDGRKTDS